MLNEPKVQVTCKEITEKEAKWKWEILQTINVPITARIRISCFRHIYDPQQCPNCEIYKEHGSKFGTCTGCNIAKYCSKSAKRKTGQSINHIADKLFTSES